MIRILIISSFLILFAGCTKQVCVSPHKCEKKLDWNNPGFTVVRTIITQGANAGN